MKKIIQLALILVMLSISFFAFAEESLSTYESDFASTKYGQFVIFKNGNLSIFLPQSMVFFEDYHGVEEEPAAAYANEYMSVLFYSFEGGTVEDFLASQNANEDGCEISETTINGFPMVKKNCMTDTGLTVKAFYQVDADSSSVEIIFIPKDGVEDTIINAYIDLILESARSPHSASIADFDNNSKWFGIPLDYENRVIRFPPSFIVVPNTGDDALFSVGNEYVMVVAFGYGDTTIEAYSDYFGYSTTDNIISDEEINGIKVRVIRPLQIKNVACNVVFGTENGDLIELCFIASGPTTEEIIWTYANQIISRISPYR